LVAALADEIAPVTTAELINKDAADKTAIFFLANFINCPS
jgi:hypothetical protein